mgnify:CR=1 FL=1
MKDAAESYFTLERLPQKEGDKITLTLKQMLDKKLLLPLTDKNNNKVVSQILSIGIKEIPWVRAA